MPNPRISRMPAFSHLPNVAIQVFETGKIDWIRAGPLQKTGAQSRHCLQGCRIIGEFRRLDGLRTVAFASELGSAWQKVSIAEESAARNLDWPKPHADLREMYSSK